MLIVVLSAGSCAPAMAEGGVTAGELLLGVAATPTVSAEQTATAQPEETAAAEPTTVEPTAQTAEHEDVYGANDAASISAYKTLQLGDRDEADGAAYIVMMQNRLRQLGFLNSSADGVFGEATQTAVKQFQKLNGLEQTGIADAAMQEKLFSDAMTLTTPSPENPVVFGSEPVRVQSKLVEWGFLIGSVDGKLGKGSEAAIKSFKTYVHEEAPQEPTPSPEPTPTPTPEPTTAPGELPSVRDELLTTPEPVPTPYVATGEVDADLLSYIDGERPFAIYRETVQKGDKSPEVRRVQVRLKQLGYLYADPDGAFGSGTALALKYFQRKHGLMESGIADEETQRVLFSGAVQKAEEYVFPYKLVVDISEQRVYAYEWDGDDYSNEVKKMVCSTGKDATPTPLGTYQSYGRMTVDEWYYFKKFKCYAKYAYGIVGGILFHSVTFNKEKVLNKGSVNNLGRKASHGCIRLEIENAQWICDNCPLGTTVVIQE